MGKPLPASPSLLPWEEMSNSDGVGYSSHSVSRAVVMHSLPLLSSGKDKFLLPLYNSLNGMKRAKNNTQSNIGHGSVPIKLF